MRGTWHDQMRWAQALPAPFHTLVSAPNGQTDASLYQMTASGERIPAHKGGFSNNSDIPSVWILKELAGMNTLTTSPVDYYNACQFVDYFFMAYLDAMVAEELRGEYDV